MVYFEWYRSIIAVYRSGTVTGAAEAQFLTQSAIAAIESAIGHECYSGQYPFKKELRASKQR